MNLARSTFYDKPAAQSFGDAKIVEKIGEICADYPRYGYRRVTAQLHREGLAVNHKRAMRIMREQGLSVRPRRRFVVTTNSDHDGPIFPNLARELIPTGPNELWVADLHRDCERLRLSRGDSGRLVATCRWLCTRTRHRHAAHAGCVALSDHEPPTATRLRSSLGPRSAVCRRTVPADAWRPWPARLHGAARCPL